MMRHDTLSTSRQKSSNSPIYCDIRPFSLRDESIRSGIGRNGQVSAAEHAACGVESHSKEIGPKWGAP